MNRSSVSSATTAVRRPYLRPLVEATDAKSPKIQALRAMRDGCVGTETPLPSDEPVQDPK